VYDGNKIEEQIQKMRDAFSGITVKLKYACKALTNINIMKLMLKNGVDDGGVQTCSSSIHT
jgi:diaminopimelate decarboxylase